MERPASERHLLRSAVAVGILLTAMLAPRLPSAGTLGYMQHLWFARIVRFLDALTSGNLADTFQGPHPGVTLMWILGAGLEVRTWIGGAPDPVARLWTFEVMQILWSTAVMILVFFALRRAVVVYGTPVNRAHWTALLAAVLAALDPMFLTLTQVMSLDGPLAAHVALALCLFLTALRTSSLRDYLLAAVATGLAVLTKMSALVFVFGIAICFVAQAARPRVTFPERRRVVRRAAAFGAVLALTIVVCWPALWVAPWSSLRRVALTDEQAEQLRGGELGELLAAQEQQAGLDSILDVVLHPHRPGNARVVYGRTTSAWLHYPYVILFKTPPLTLLLAGAGVVLALAGVRRRTPEPILRLVGHLAAWDGLYFVCMSIAAKKTWRYMAIVEVLLELCAGLTLAWLIALVARRYGRVWAVALALAVALQVGHILAHAPHFIAYYNPLAGGRAAADEYLMLYWGEGAGEAAQYMHDQAREQPARFITENWDLANLLRIMLGESDLVGRAEDAEFLVISYREVLLRTMSRGARYYWSTRPPEYVATIRGVPYAWVYRLDKKAAP